MANATCHPNTNHRHQPSWPVEVPIFYDGLDPLDNDGALAIQLIRIPLMALLLAVLQPGTLMILQHPMLAAEMSLAEGAIAYDALRRLLAVFVRAADFLRRSAADGKCDMEGGGRRDGERFKGGGDVGCGC